MSRPVPVACAAALLLLVAAWGASFGCAPAVRRGGPPVALRAAPAPSARDATRAAPPRPSARGRPAGQREGRGARPAVPRSAAGPSGAAPAARVPPLAVSYPPTAVGNGQPPWGLPHSARLMAVCISVGLAAAGALSHGIARSVCRSRSRGRPGQWPWPMGAVAASGDGVPDAGPGPGGAGAAPPEPDWAARVVRAGVAEVDDALVQLLGAEGRAVAAHCPSLRRYSSASLLDSVPELVAVAGWERARRMILQAPQVLTATPENIREAHGVLEGLLGRRRALRAMETNPSLLRSRCAVVWGGCCAVR